MAAVFALGGAALLAVVEYSVSRYAVEAAGDGVLAEHYVLAAEFRSLGRTELIAAIERHEQAVREKQFRYLLMDAHGRRLTGSLPQSSARIGWHDIDIGVLPFMAFGDRLPDNSMLVVASDVTDLRNLRRDLRYSTVGFGFAIIVLALAGGLFVGKLFLRRLDRVNGAISRIIDGRLTERLPPIGMGPEFDQLCTHLNRMLDRIETLMDGLRQVSTDIAHDLRTPLSRLRHRLERIQLGTDPASVEEQIEGAIGQIDEILRIFSALLRIGALEARESSAISGTIDLTDLLKRLVQIYAPVVEDAGHDLTDAIEPGLIVRGDVDLLVQAITNLIENAIHHTPAGTSIALSSRRHGEVVRIGVADDGPGIPERERERVLRRFYRLNASRSSPGAGLGLSLADAIARLHGTSLKLSDNNPGLRIEMDLPATGHSTGRECSRS